MIISDFNRFLVLWAFIYGMDIIIYDASTSFVEEQLLILHCMLLVGNNKVMCIKVKCNLEWIILSIPIIQFYIGLI